MKVFRRSLQCDAQAARGTFLQSLQLALRTEDTLTARPPKIVRFTNLVAIMCYFTDVRVRLHYQLILKVHKLNFADANSV